MGTVQYLDNGVVMTVDTEGNREVTMRISGDSSKDSFFELHTDQVSALVGQLQSWLARQQREGK